MVGTVRVSGLREFQSKLKRADSALAGDVQKELKEIGDVVVRAADARGSRYNQIGPYKPIVRQRDVTVRQSRDKVTGLRGDFGALQMRNVLLPVLGEKEDEVREGFEQMLDRLIATSGL